MEVEASKMEKDVEEDFGVNNRDANYMKSGLRVGLWFDDGHEDHHVGVDELSSSIMCLPNGN